MTDRQTISRRAVLSTGGAISLTATTVLAAAPNLPPQQLMSSVDGRFVHDRALFGELSDMVGYLTDFEKHGQKLPTYAPFQFCFEDLTSTEIQGDRGAYRANSPRVFPDRYSITRERLSFDGFDKQVGRVKFRGRFTDAFLGPRPYDRSRPDVEGSLTLNGKTFNKLGFRFWMGD